MQIVIDIPEEIYKASKIIDVQHEDVVQIPLEVITNGIPLPKGHGRITDMDEAIKCIEDVEGEDAIWAIALIEWACSKRTILEAERAESEKDGITFNNLCNSCTNIGCIFQSGIVRTKCAFYMPPHIEADKEIDNECND